MSCKALLCSTSVYDSKRLPKLQTQRAPTLQIRCSNSSPDTPSITEKLEHEASMTGAAYDFNRATTSLTRKLLSSPKKVTLVRHGLSSWNQESRIQGSSNLSVLTETGVRQAERCREALANIYFDQCFSSPICRAKSTAEVIWQGREGPLVFLDSLKEAHLFFLEGMKNDTTLTYIQCLEAVDARREYPKEYITWREDPANFNVNGVYPLRKIWATASEAWTEILYTPCVSFIRENIFWLSLTNQY
ncbi:probable 2-carboxy-D-arabinitol-1-phosphatase isoform X3 [Vitis riparia]|uniref:probable 2-carboxy-D-arabinitol-1-phosphatase isoform X3 n=1 Tax=Vitis riparia TaxID=96939 RepID=UPI00155A7E27|nr:probable 2-carboxy-D-arabinitol-1-phosphatase isoform X3 [Vitis riparia]